VNKAHGRGPGSRTVGLCAMMKRRRSESPGKSPSCSSYLTLPSSRPVPVPTAGAEKQLTPPFLALAGARQGELAPLTRDDAIGITIIAIREDEEKAGG